MIEQPRQSWKMEAAKAALRYSLEQRRQRREEFRNEVNAPIVWQPDTPGYADDEGEYFRAERTRPVRPPSVGSDVVTPLLQAAVFGGLAWAVVSVLAAEYRLLIGGECITALGVTALAYGLSVGASRRTMWVTEVIERGAPVERVAALPLPPSPPIQLEVTQRDERGRLTGIQRFNLPADLAEKLPQFAAGVLGGKGLSQAAWTGRGNLLSRAEFETLLDTLASAGIVRWVDVGNRQQGRELTVSGRAALRQLAEEA